MTNVNWNLASQGSNGFTNALTTGLKAGQLMRQSNDRREYRNALAVLATEPEDKGALASVFAQNPQVGVQLANRADDMAFARDTGDFVASGNQPNALAGFMPQAPAQTPAAPIAKAGNPQNGTDLSALGKPQSKEDAAFVRMLRRDPKEALKIKSAMRDNFVAQAKAESDFYGLAIGELSRAQDEASWTQAYREVSATAQVLGIDLASKVPAEYPNPEGVKALMERAQPIKEQLDLLLREANVDADNARADRNTDSMIETREGRLAEYERRGRESASIRRRGQDLTDRRARNRSGAPKGAKPETDIPVVASPAEAMELPSGTRFKTPDGKVKVRP